MRGAINTWFYRILVNESLALLKERRRMPLQGENQEEGTVRGKGL